MFLLLNGFINIPNIYINTTSVEDSGLLECATVNVLVFTNIPFTHRETAPHNTAPHATRPELHRNITANWKINLQMQSFKRFYRKQR